jgi:2-hydroxychromene-2-carboxylate isomerase
MTDNIDVFYDFRSPYAYFAAHRLRHRLFQAPVPVNWNWRPISIDVLLNLQAGREPLAAYVDPLPAPKRRHLLADVRRCAEMYDAPLKSPRPARPNPQTALCLALLLRKRGIADCNFRNAVFAALWEEQRDIADSVVLGDCLSNTDVTLSTIEEASSSQFRAELIRETQQAYESGIFGVPTFVLGDEIFFGNDRLDMVGWRLRKQGPGR